MLRFFLDMFRFPFAIGHPKNKFGYVLQFMMKDFPAYFRVKPTRRKIAIFPFLVFYLICKKQKYERFGFVAQLFFVVFCFGFGFFGWGLYQVQRNMSIYKTETIPTYAYTVCTLDPFFFRFCSQGELYLGIEFFDQGKYRAAMKERAQQIKNQKQLSGEALTGDLTNNVPTPVQTGGFLGGGQIPIAQIQMSLSGLDSAQLLKLKITLTQKIQLATGEERLLLEHTLGEVERQIIDNRE